MVRVEQVRMVSGGVKWAVKNIFTGKTVANPVGPGMARFDTREEAEAVLELCVSACERDAM